MNLRRFIVIVAAAFLAAVPVRAIFFVSSGGGGTATGFYDANGNFQYFSQVATALDTNGFNVINGTVYNSALLSGGSVQLINESLTNYSSVYFSTNSRLILASVQSLKYAQLDGAWNVSAAAALAPPAPLPVLQMSTDGGNSWTSIHSTNTPALLSLYEAGSVTSAGASNLLVIGYSNPNAIGASYDFSGQFVELDNTILDNRTAVNVFTAHGIGATEAAKWAGYPAASPVNFAGQNVTYSGAWSQITASNSIVWNAYGLPAASFTAGAIYGSAPFITSLTISNAVATFKLLASSVPTMWVKTNLLDVSWTSLANQSNWNAGGYWWVSAPINPALTNCFFRASIAGTNTVPNKFNFNGQITGQFIFTNAAGSKFALVVNSTTNGFAFVPQ